ncbi:MAG: cation diffusion facilitator family transporter [Deltaproteobacteria bacterium]
MTELSEPTEARVAEPHPVSAAQAIAVALASNLVLAGGKIAYGIFVGSVGLRADGFHNLVDAVGSGVALFAAGWAAQPPDRGHPYGHRRIELLGALAVGLFIAAGALEVGSTGLERLLAGGSTPHPADLGIAAVLASAALSFAVSTWEARVLRRGKSLLVEADVRHQRLDVIGTVLVTLGLVASKLGHGRADAAAALLVLVVVGYGALGIVSASLTALADTAQLDPTEIEREVRAVDGVLGCHKVRSRGAPGAVYVDLHIQVDPEMPIRSAHALGHAVKHRVETVFPGVVDVLVHVEPDD